MKNTLRLSNLDVIKIIASLLIVFHHYQQLSGLTFDNGINFYGGLFNFAYLVELFFMISGFLTVYNFNNDVKFKIYFLKK